MMPVEPFSLVVTNHGKSMIALASVEKGILLEYNGVRYPCTCDGWACIAYQENLPPDLSCAVIIPEKELLRIDGAEIWINR